MKDRMAAIRRNSGVALDDTARQESLDVRRKVDDLCRENHQYQQEIARLKEELRRSADRELALNEELTSSRNMDVAHRHSKSIVQEAEKRASRIIEDAQGRVNASEPCLLDLKRERKVLQEKVQESIDIIEKLLLSSNLPE